MGSSLVFQFLDINVLNYCYFHTGCLAFLKIKNVGKIKKTFINVYYNYGCCWCCCCYQICDLLRLFHFITDRRQHTRQHSPQSYRDGFST